MLSNDTTVGIGCAILFVWFLVLKLTGVVVWSWWIVTAPLWVPVAACLAVVALGLAAVFCESAWRSACRTVQAARKGDG